MRGQGRLSRFIAKHGCATGESAAPFLVALALLAGTVLFAAPASAQLIPWSDPSGDVTLSNADMVSGSAAIDEDVIHLRVTFVDPPFPSTATHFIEWCVDLDQDPTTGTLCGGIPGGIPGAEGGVSFTSVPLAPTPLSLVVGREGNPPVVLNPAANAIVDPAANAVCVFFPKSLLSDDGIFNYVVLSSFGGSSGANDLAPDNPDLGSPSGFFTSEAGAPPPCAGQDETPCLTQGFWKTHPESWPGESLQLGSETYEKPSLLTILWTPPTGDASLILAHQLIAVKLNVDAGAPASAIEATVSAADRLLAGFSGKLPYGVEPSTQVGQEATSLAEVLADYNEGGADCVPSAGDDGTGDPVDPYPAGGLDRAEAVIVGSMSLTLIGFAFGLKRKRY